MGGEAGYGAGLEDRLVVAVVMVLGESAPFLYRTQIKACLAVHSYVSGSQTNLTPPPPPPPSLPLSRTHTFSLSLSLSHTHTHTHTEPTKQCTHTKNTCCYGQDLNDQCPFVLPIRRWRFSPALHYVCIQCSVLIYLRFPLQPALLRLTKPNVPK